MPVTIEYYTRDGSEWCVNCAMDKWGDPTLPVDALDEHGIPYAVFEGNGGPVFSTDETPADIPLGDGGRDVTCDGCGEVIAQHFDRRSKRRGGSPEKVERNDQIAALCLAGWSDKKIAEHFGIAECRPGQIIRARNIKRPARPDYTSLFDMASDGQEWTFYYEKDFHHLPQTFANRARDHARSRQICLTTKVRGNAVTIRRV